MACSMAGNGEQAGRGRRRWWEGARDGVNVREERRSKDRRGRIGGYTGDKKDTQWREVFQQLL